MENDINNCGACYFYDDINTRDRTIYCILWQKRQGQYEPCDKWMPHKNGLKQIKEVRAQGIRYQIAKAKQNQADQERQEESKELAKHGISETKKWSKKGIRTTIFWAILCIAIAIALYFIFK